MADTAGIKTRQTTTEIIETKAEISQKLNFGEYKKVREVFEALAQLVYEKLPIAGNGSLVKSLEIVFKSRGIGFNFDFNKGAGETKRVLEALTTAINNIGEESQTFLETELVSLEKVGTFESRALNKSDLEVLVDALEKGEVKEDGLVGYLEKKRGKSFSRDEIDRVVKHWQELADKYDKSASLKIGKDAPKELIREVAEEMASCQILTSKGVFEGQDKRIAKFEEVVTETVEKILNENVVNDAVLGRVRKGIDRQIKILSKKSPEFAKELQFRRAIVVGNVARMEVEIEALKRANEIIEAIEVTRVGTIPPIDRVKLLREIAEKIVQTIGKDPVLARLELEKGVEEAVKGVAKTDEALAGEVKESIRVEATKIVKATGAMETSNPHVVFYAKQEEMMREVISWAEAKQIDQQATDDYLKMVSRLFGSDEMAKFYLPLKQAIAENSQELGVVKANRAADQTRSFVAMLRSKQKIGDFVYSYQKLKDQLGGVADVPVLKELDNLIGAIQKSPELMKMMEATQKALGVWDTVNNFSGQLLTKIGFEKAGMAMLEKIGGQAMANFASEAVKAFGSTETMGQMTKLVGSLLKQLLTKGAVSGGTAAAEAGATGAATVGGGGLVAAFQALPVVGQVIAVVAIVVAAGAWVYKKFIKPIVSKVKGWLAKIGIDTEALNLFSGLKRGIKENFGGLIGGVAGFVLNTADLIIKAVALAATLAFAWILKVIAPVAVSVIGGIALYQLLVTNPLGSALAPGRESMGMIGSGLEYDLPYIDVDPIFGEECEMTLACVAMEALLQNGLERVVPSNVGRAVSILRNLIGQYSHFNIARFNSVMDYNTNEFGAFQCIGYSIASDPSLTTSPSWQLLYSGEQPGCMRIAPENAGVDDHIVFPLRNGHYHIGVLVAVREDGSGIMYDVNYDGNGSLHKWPILNIVDFVSGNNQRNPGQPLTVLRCP